MWPGSCEAAQSEWVSCPACHSPGPQQEAHVKPQLDVPAEPTHREKVPVKPAVTSSDQGAEVEQPSTPTWARPDFRHPDTWPPCRGWLCFMWVSGAVQSVRICEQVSQPPSYWTEAAARPPLNPELTHDTTCLFIQRHRANEKKGLTMRERVPMHPPCCKWLSPSFTNPHSSCRGQGTGHRHLCCSVSREETGVPRATWCGAAELTGMCARTLAVLSSGKTVKGFGAVAHTLFLVICFYGVFWGFIFPTW